MAYNNNNPNEQISDFEILKYMSQLDLNTDLLESNIEHDYDELNLDDDNSVFPFDTKYILDSEVHDFCVTKGSHGLNIMHLNCRSLKKHFCDVSQMLDMHGQQISILALTETWLNDHNEDIFQIDRYNFIFKCREGKTGGGVGMYVNCSLEFCARQIYVFQTNLLNVCLLKFNKLQIVVCFLELYIDFQMES